MRQFVIFVQAMGKVILYIAASLNGCIAKPDGNLDWLTSIPAPSTGGDYGYTELLDRISTIIMGRKTYEEVLKMDIKWPYSQCTTYVISRQSDISIQSPKTYLVNNFKEVVLHLKNSLSKDIFLVGGGQLITAFLQADLIDTMIITFVPKILEEGIPLFSPKPKESEWNLIGVDTFDTGLISVVYDKKTN